MWLANGSHVHTYVGSTYVGGCVELKVLTNTDSRWAATSISSYLVPKVDNALWTYLHNHHVLYILMLGCVICLRTRWYYIYYILTGTYIAQGCHSMLPWLGYTLGSQPTNAPHSKHTQYGTDNVIIKIVEVKVKWPHPVDCNIYVYVCKYTHTYTYVHIQSLNLS